MFAGSAIAVFVIFLKIALQSVLGSYKFKKKYFLTTRGAKFNNILIFVKSQSLTITVTWF